MRQRKTGCGTKVNEKIKYYCGNCAKELGKGSLQKPSIWCNICGWVHFNCSGLQRVGDYKKTLDFLCSKCAVTRKLVDSTAESSPYSKIHNVYTSCNNPAAFTGRNALKKASKCSYRQVDNFLNRSQTFPSSNKPARNRLPRLKVQSFRLNELWSVDLANMQKLSRYNHGINFIFVAVNILSRFVWALPLRKKTASECQNALQKSWKPFAREKTVQRQ